MISAIPQVRLTFDYLIFSALTCGISISGVLLDNAQELVKSPELTEEDLLKRFGVTVKDALSKGLTSIHDAGLDPISLKFFKRSVFAVFPGMIETDV